MMHGFSTGDGFVEITECLAEMIKYVANEPSLGLYYVQQHSQNAVPNVVNLRCKVMEKSWETNLQTEDLEDSLSLTSSMKECGFPIVDEMVKDIRQSLTIMSTKQPRKGLISRPTSSFQIGRTVSWRTASWGHHNGASTEKDSDRSINYFSTVVKTAKEKASNFKWPQLDTKDSSSAQNKNPSQSVASTSASSLLPDSEADELPLSSQTADELVLDEEDRSDLNQPTSNIIMSTSENYENFKAKREAKLEEWLEETDVERLEQSK